MKDESDSLIYYWLCVFIFIFLYLNSNMSGIKADNDRHSQLNDGTKAALLITQLIERCNRSATTAHVTTVTVSTI